MSWWKMSAPDHTYHWDKYGQGLPCSTTIQVRVVKIQGYSEYSNLYVTRLNPCLLKPALCFVSIKQVAGKVVLLTITDQRQGLFLPVQGYPMRWSDELVTVLLCLTRSKMFVYKR